MTLGEKLQSFFINKVWVKDQKRYIIVTLIFLSWMLFFDRYTLDKTMSLSATIESLESSKKRLEQELVNARRDKQNLEDNAEKYAREKFLMHKEDEDVFIIESN